MLNSLGPTYRKANAMSRHKIVRRNHKSKLPSVAVGEGLFDLEELMEGLELDMRSFASSAGLQVMKQLIDREVMTFPP
jgi:hypothetical protein